MDSNPKTTSPEAPTRRSTLAVFNPAAATNQLWRLVSSRERMIEQFKTLLWVVPITLVIWIYAEREQVINPNSPNVKDVHVSFNKVDGLYIEPVGGGEPASVDLQLTGPQTALEAVREQLTTRIPHGVRIDLSNIGIGKSQQVNVMDHLASSTVDVFKRNGVSVMKVQPEFMYVNVERMGRKELPVLIPPEIDTLAPETHFVPATVTLSGPESLFNSDLKVYADLTAAQVPKKSGPYTLASIPLKRPSEKLQIDPPQVKGELVVRNADVQSVIDHLFIRVQAPLGTLTRFDVTLPAGETADGTHVTGPADKIKLLTDDPTKWYAVLEILPDDPQPRKQLTYVLPEGVSVSPQDQQRQFDYTLKVKPQ